MEASPEKELSSPVTLPEFLSESDSESDVSFKEEMIEEVMQELYKEIAWPEPEPEESTCKEKRGGDTAGLVVESGKSESCGACMSESGSSVMAGVNFAAGGNMIWVDVDVDEMDGCDEVDEWLEKGMEWSPVDFEGWA